MPINNFFFLTHSGTKIIFFFNRNCDVFVKIIIITKKTPSFCGSAVFGEGTAVNKLCMLGSGKKYIDLVHWFVALKIDCFSGTTRFASNITRHCQIAVKVNNTVKNSDSFPAPRSVMNLWRCQAERWKNCLIREGFVKKVTQQCPRIGFKL